VILLILLMNRFSDQDDAGMVALILCWFCADAVWRFYDTLNSMQIIINYARAKILHLKKDHFPHNVRAHE